MKHLTINCLGDFNVALNGSPIDGFETDKARALLAYLAIEIGRPLRRSHLAGLLWGDEREDKALHSLRQTLSRLRKTLPDAADMPPFFLAERDTLQLNPQAEINVDYHVFNTLLDEALQYHQKLHGSGYYHIRKLQQAANLLHAPFLHQFAPINSTSFEEWAEITRRKVHLRAETALSLLIDYHQRREEYQQAITIAMKALALEPWDESMHLRLMHLLCLSRQYSACQSHFLNLQQRYTEQLGLPLSDEAHQLYQQARLADAGKFNFQVHITNTPLPEITRTFIGRQMELDEIMAMAINPEIRLITITGAGGIGKTQLALQLAHQLNGIWQDGVYFVQGIAIQKPGQIIPLIAETLGLVFSDQADLQTQLIEYLTEKELLLVFDNFEHLMIHAQSSSIISVLLQNLPGLTCLITSRERLNLASEYVYLLKGLPYPQDGDDNNQQMETCDALTLFLTRIRQTQQGFQLQQESLTTAVNICKILDGLPLGIELAAAAIFEKGIKIVSAEIATNLDVLTSKITNLPERHRNLRAAFEVSWQLLDAHEKTSLANLSVFSNGFDQPAALKVADSSVDVLAVLSYKSLIHFDGIERYTMHEIIRQFAAEKLAEIDEAASLPERHTAYFVEFLYQRNTCLKNAGQLRASQEIQREFGNIEKAWHWVISHQHTTAIIKATDSLFQFFFTRSMFQEGMDWFENACEALSDQPAHQLAVAILKSRLGFLALLTHQLDKAAEVLHEANNVLESLNAMDERAICWQHLGWLYHYRKQFAQAQNCAQNALAFFNQKRDTQGETQALILLGAIQSRQGNLSNAKTCFERALSNCLKNANPRQLLAIHNRLADLLCWENQYEKAVEQFDEALKISEQINDRYHQAILLNNLGTVYHIWRNYAQARIYYLKSLAICRDIGDQDGIALALNNLGEIAIYQQDYTTALDYTEKALAIARQIDEKWTIIVCLNSLGQICCATNALEESKGHFIAAMQQAHQINAMDLLVRVSVYAARTWQLSGEVDQAQAMLQAALAHPVLESEERHKAEGWLAEMCTPTTIAPDEHALEAVLRQYHILTS